ncbi:MAG: single-stranded-DNA-specific exonuclease RecJ [Zavarzinella sp.]
MAELQAVRKEWLLMPHDREAIDRLARASELPPLVAQLLLNRNVENVPQAKRFLSAPFSGLYLPDQLPGVVAAVDLIMAAINRRAKICVYGDYDVDGITGTSILYTTLRHMGADVQYYLPKRLEEGYGVNVQALRTLAASGVQLVITVDCGIASLEEAREARKLGLELIVTDHHTMKAELPEAAVCVHPRLPNTSYPFGELSGAGVAFKLSWALAVRHCGSEKVTPAFREVLLNSVGLATLGLIADVVPMEDENRIIVRAGMKHLRQSPSLGMKALMEAAKLLSDKPLRSSDVGFRLAPRMNAAGRLGCAAMVVEMLTTNSADKAKEIAEYLESQNSERQSIERKMFQQAKELLAEQPLDTMPAAVLAHPEWHPGVVGILASRIVDFLGRPAIMFAQVPDKEVITGSGRSITGFKLNEALQACDHLLEGYGGHPMAVGAKIRPENLARFREMFQNYARANFPNAMPRPPRLNIDAEVPLNVWSYRLLDQLDLLEPYGPGNPEPKFLTGDLQVVGSPRRVGGGERTLSFSVKQGNTRMRAVGFNMGERLEELMSEEGRCCLVYKPVINEWNDQTSIQLQVVDFQAGPTATLA